MEAPLLSVEGCSFAYRGGDFRLQDVSLDVSSGRVVAIVGPNGSGKSTLLRLMAGLLRPDPGRVLLEGRAVHSMSRKRLARALAFLPQEPETSFGFAVREVVAMGRYPHLGTFGFLAARDIEVVERALHETAAAALASRPFSTLSGGEKQRVLIAGILAQEPSLMLLDEPTAALDIHHCYEVLDLLRRLSRRGIGIVLVTHDLNAAAQFSDRLILLAAGRVARAGTPAQVMDQGLLSAVYQADVRVIENPVTLTPMVILTGKASDEAN